MNENELGAMIGAIVETEALLSLDQLLLVCSVQMEYVVELVEEGVLEVCVADSAAAPPETALQQVPEEWYFSGTCLHRVRIACRLQQDLGVNVAGVAVILDLLDQVRLLESKLKQYSHL